MATKRKTKRSTAARREPIANRGLHGEGNYQASREYNEATHRFANSGCVADAARRARPQSQAEAAELEEAERIGREHARGEEPLDLGLPSETGRRSGGGR